MKRRRTAERVVPLGTFVHPFGKIGAVGTLNGERYYWTVGHDGAVGMMPAIVIERAAHLRASRRGKR